MFSRNSSGAMSGFHVGLRLVIYYITRLETLIQWAFSSGLDVGRNSDLKNPAKSLAGGGFSSGRESTVLTDGCRFYPATRRSRWTPLQSVIITTTGA